jgi:hypothetical protein
MASDKTIITCAKKYYDVVSILKNLEETHVLVESLGDWKRGEVISHFCNMCLKDFPAIRLDNTETVYTQLIALLRCNALIFLPRWGVPEIIANEFCTRTHNSLATALNKNRDGMPVSTMILALEGTVKFEEYLVNRFEPDEVTDVKNKKFKGLISSAFEPYLNMCLLEEDANIRESIARSIEDETWSLEENAQFAILASGTDILYYLNVSLNHCSKLGSIQLLSDLHIIFRKYIESYADTLMTHVSTGFQQQDLKTICLIANTVNLWHNRCEQFQTSFMTKTNTDTKISFDSEITRFITIRSRCVELLATLTCSELTKSFQNMTHNQWITQGDVHDESEYVTSIISIVKEKCAPMIQQYLDACPENQVSLYPAYCTAFTKKFSKLLIENVYMCKKIGESGSIQLLLDVSCLHTMMQQLTCVGDAKLTDDVQTDMKYIEHILKISAAPINMIIETYRNVFPSGTTKDLARIIDLRGVSRGERNMILETFTGTAAQQKSTIVHHLTGMFGDIASVVKK